jgi:hypothetical protein
VGALLVFGTALALGWMGEAGAVSQEAAARLRQDVEFLAATDRGGRAPGSKGAQTARAYIQAALTEAGCRPAEDAVWLQRVPAPGSSDESEVNLPEGTSWSTVEMANVVGILPGSASTAADPSSDPPPSGGRGGGSEPAGSSSVSGTGPGTAGSGAESGVARHAVVVGAHLDHLGIVDGTVYAGADDNASGVAILLEVARAMSRSGPFANDVVFVAFDGEEAGLLGSRHYTQHPAAPLTQTIAMINLDTIGRMQDRRLYAMASGTSAEFPEILNGVNLGFGFDLATPNEGSFASDHLAFIERGVPAIHLSTGANADYHRPGDTADKIQWAELAETAAFVTELASFLADETAPLAFVPPGADRVAAPAENPAPRRVSLGTIPDFARESGGVLLTGVMPGSPAEKAGLQKGDVVVALAGTPVDNLADFSAVLKAHQPGDEVVVEFQRDGKALQEKVTLVERSTR